MLTIHFIVNFSENVVLDDTTTTLLLEIGGVARNAVYVSNTANHIIYSYTIQKEDNDDSGIVVKSIISNTTSIKDVKGNNAILTLQNVGNTTGIVIDNLGPRINSTSIAANNTYVDITFSEGVYGANNGVTALTADKLNLIFTKNSGSVTDVKISAVKKNNNSIEASASELSGGETTIRVFLTLTGGISNGKETIEIKPVNATSIYDKMGNAISVKETTGITYLTNNTSSLGGSSTSNGQDRKSTSTDDKFEMFFNDDSQKAATIEVNEKNGVKTSTITLSDDAVKENLNKMSNNNANRDEANKVIISVSNNSNVVAINLNGQILKNMEEKNATLEIKTKDIGYIISAKDINIDNILEKMGEQVQLKDIQINVSVLNAPEETIKIVEDSAKNLNYQLIVKPVEFEISCSDGRKTVDVSRFNNYVERTVALPDGADPNKITTGVVANKDGTFSHVPTSVVVIDGKYYAKINSLTNSTYTVIWNPVTFKDVEKHWSKTYVNEVGSRLIDDGVGNGNFAPDRAITRAEFASMVVKALGLKGTKFPEIFNDVNRNDSYYNAIYTAYEYGIIAGYSNGKFGPQDLLTREQAMTMLAKAMEITGMNVNVSDTDVSNQLRLYIDSDNISSYARQKATICIKNGIFAGDNEGRLTPKDSFTRAQSATAIIKLLKKSRLI